MFYICLQVCQSIVFPMRMFLQVAVVFYMRMFYMWRSCFTCECVYMWRSFFTCECVLHVAVVLFTCECIGSHSDGSDLFYMRCSIGLYGPVYFCLLAIMQESSNLPFTPAAMAATPPPQSSSRTLVPPPPPPRRCFSTGTVRVGGTVYLATEAPNWARS